MRRIWLAIWLGAMAASALAQSPAAVDNLKQQSGAIAGADGDIAIRLSDKIHGYGSNRDEDINSPKSATFSKDGKKIYVNSLEGGKTVVYDAVTHQKLKTISHNFESGKGDLWLPWSGFYEFTHYPDGQNKSFMGKPVEAALTKDGRYLFVPYYRRTFDLNAQDPSALAIIDTGTDEIVAMTETGPLPKMVKVSNDGKLLAITHWGNNTVGFMDISDENPRNWKHLEPVTIGQKLNLNYSLTTAVNRDSGSGYLLRGTQFLPGDSLLLVSGMAGPVAVIDVKNHEWIGMISQLSSVRHITMKNGLLYMSRNSAGDVITVPVDEVKKAVAEQRGTTRDFKIQGVRRVAAGSGARTLKVSPSGNYIFVACNSATELCVVRTEDMKVVARIPADPFPVGLDISPDGTQIVTTSQGRSGRGGGNAVNFFEVAFAAPEISPEALPEPTDLDPETPGDSTAVAEDAQAEERLGKSPAWYWGFGTGILIIALLSFFIFRKRGGKEGKD